MLRKKKNMQTLILKIMSGEDLSDSDSGKECEIYTNVVSVKYVKPESQRPHLLVTQLLPVVRLLHPSADTISMSDIEYDEAEKVMLSEFDDLGQTALIHLHKGFENTRPIFAEGLVESIIQMEGNAYLMNDNGKTIQAFAATKY